MEVLEKKNTKYLVQCHKCQSFGHVQNNCHANYKCMKCADSHTTHKCKKPRTTPPKCDNCGEEHLLTYKKYKLNPNAKEQARNEVKQPQENPWTRIVQTKPQNDQDDKQETNNKTELNATLGEMLAEFVKKNATNKQKLNFLKLTSKVKALCGKKNQ